MAKTATVGVLTEAQGAHLAEYFKSLAEIDEVEKVTIADPSGECFAKARDVLKGKLAGEYRSAADLLKSGKPDLALVSMEAVNTPPVVDAALDAGCHVVSEKPGCVKAADFAALARKADGKHLQVMLSLANRPHVSIREARRIVRSGQLGRLFGLELHMIADQARLTSEGYRNLWFCKKARSGGGHLVWLGIHWLDVALFVTGAKVRRVAGFVGNVGGQPIDVEDSAAVALQFDGGLLGTMLSGYYLDETYKKNVQGYHSHLQLWGEKGWLRMSVFDEQPIEFYTAKADGPPAVQRFEYPKGQRGYLPFLRSAVRFSLGLEEAPITSAEGLHVLQTIFAAYAAAETGTTQSIE